MLKEFALVVVILMSDRAPVTKMMPMPSLEACWDAAKEFAGRELAAEVREQGVIGLGATCAWREKPSREG